jgi:hypothetical protein
LAQTDAVGTGELGPKKTRDQQTNLLRLSNQKVDITGETRMTMEGNGMAADHEKLSFVRVQ